MYRSYKGRIIGGILGFLFFNVIGLVAGALLGYYLYDKPNLQKAKQVDAGQRFFGQNNSLNNRELIRATFCLMGYVARGAGRINEQHISKAKYYMGVMNLDAESRKDAEEAFNHGKSDAFDARSQVEAIKFMYRDNEFILSYLLEIQVQLALADAVLDEGEHQRLLEIARYANVSTSAMERLIQIRFAEIRFAQAYKDFSSSSDYSSSNSYEQRDNSRAYSRTSASELENAYALLGLEPSATPEEVKRAHKKLMFKYHPDRLASQGLSKEMVNLYTQKAKDIQAAYDLIIRERGEK